MHGSPQAHVQIASLPHASTFKPRGGGMATGNPNAESSDSNLSTNKEIYNDHVHVKPPPLPPPPPPPPQARSNSEKVGGGKDINIDLTFDRENPFKYFSRWGGEVKAGKATNHESLFLGVQTNCNNWGA